MPEQKKFFVLCNNYSGFPATTLHCLVVAGSPEEVAQLLQGTFTDYTKEGPVRIGESEKRCQGSIALSRDLFLPATEAGMEDYLEYKRGCFHFFVHKNEEPSVFLEELPIMGKCEWHKRGEEVGIPKDCGEVGTLLAENVHVLCPDAYRLLIDDNYKKDK